jgi:hypothetical protein
MRPNRPGDGEDPHRHPVILRRLSLKPLWPEPERMVVRGTVLVPHRSLLVTAT